jgi:FkbM family methyltransferase
MHRQASPFGRLLRRVRRNRFFAAVAWRVVTPLHTASLRTRFLAEKVRRNGGTVTYDGIALRFPPNVGVDFLSSIHWNGTDGYEPDVWRALRQLISSSRTFIDVGTHIGFYAVLAHKINPKLSIFAFEPVPELFSEAQQFFNANGVATEGLHRLALSSEDGEGTLFLPIDYATMGSLAGPPLGLQSREIHVTRERLDTFLARRPIIAPVTIKIDVEDHEVEVLSGARETIAKYRPSIVCELLPRADNAKTVKLIDEMGYAAFAITKRGCFRMRPDDFAKPRQFRDFVLMPNESVESTRCFLPFEALGS